MVYVADTVGNQIRASFTDITCITPWTIPSPWTSWWPCNEYIVSCYIQSSNLFQRTLSFNISVYLEYQPPRRSAHRLRRVYYEKGSSLFEVYDEKGRSLFKVYDEKGRSLFEVYDKKGRSLVKSIL